MDASWFVYWTGGVRRKPLSGGVGLIIAALLKAAKPRPDHQTAEYRTDVSAPKEHAVGRIQHFRDRQIQPLQLAHIFLVQAWEHHMVWIERLPEAEGLIAFVVVGQVVPVLEVSENDIGHAIAQRVYPVQKRVDTVRRTGNTSNADKAKTEGLKLFKRHVEPPVEHLTPGAGLQIGDDQ